MTGTRTKTILAVGGHVGGLDLTAGPLPAEHIPNGHRGMLLALRPGERGRPRLAPDLGADTLAALPGVGAVAKSVKAGRAAITTIGTGAKAATKASVVAKTTGRTFLAVTGGSAASEAPLRQGAALLVGRQGGECGWPPFRHVTRRGVR